MNINREANTNSNKDNLGVSVQNMTMLVIVYFRGVWPEQ